MIVELAMGAVLGAVIGAAALYGNLGHRRIRGRVFNKILSTNSEGWLLIQEGQRYLWRPVTHSDGGMSVQIDEQEHHFEGSESMHDLLGVPVGLATKGPTSVVDVEAAAATEHMDADADMPALQPDDTLSVRELRDRMKVGEMQTNRGAITMLNPFAKTDGSIVDLRSVVKGMRHSGTSDLPRKAAENARLAERATEGTDLGQVGFIGSVFAAFLLGAITVEFIAGGSGGSGVSVPVMLYPLLFP